MFMFDAHFFAEALLSGFWLTGTGSSTGLKVLLPRKTLYPAKAATITATSTKINKIPFFITPYSNKIMYNLTMKSGVGFEIKAVIGIFVVGIILALTGLYIKNTRTAQMILSPFSKPLSIFSFLTSHKRPSYIVYGYLPYWTIDNSNYIQLDKLTHMAYFGLYINDDGTFQEKTVGEDGTLVAEPGYKNWNDNPKLDELIQKAKREGVRVALTVIAHDDAANDKFLNCRECWATLLENIKKELNLKQITDVNLNFEYAKYTDGDQAVRFAELTKYLNEELDKTYGDSYLVVSAFADSAIKNRISSKLNELMAYDFNRPTSDQAGPLAPIDGSGSNSGYDINRMIKDFLAQIAPNKLIFGVPYYGYNWVVENGNKYAKRIEGSEATGFSETQIYNNIMKDINELQLNVMWDETAQVPYYTYVSPETGSTRQVYFEDTRSLKVKYDLVKKWNLAGMGIWALGYDGERLELWNLISDEFVK
jgi:spore germination protein YaaH